MLVVYWARRFAALSPSTYHYALAGLFFLQANAYLAVDRVIDEAFYHGDVDPAFRAKKREATTRAGRRFVGKLVIGALASAGAAGALGVLETTRFCLQDADVRDHP